MIYTDRKYISSLSGRLRNFKQLSSNLYKFSCPFCGDSKKNKYKTRGYIFLDKSEYFFKCFNCNETSHFSKFLEHIDYSLFKEYKLESFKEQFDYKPKKEIEYKFEKPIFNKGLNIPIITDLDDTHKAKQYIINRKIPNQFYSEIYYAENFKEFILSILPEYDRNLFEESRIVFPFYDFNKSLIAVQGRLLNNKGLRYITIKLDESAPKIYGLNKLDLKKDIFVVEGIPDSLFLENSIAVCDSKLSKASEYFPKEQLILIPDKEPRSREIVDNVHNFISKGFRVCLFPESFKYKDINDYIINGGTIKKLNEIIKINTFAGLRARIEFNRWKRI